MTEYKVIVDKSTVPVGTADQVRYTNAKELSDRKLDRPFGVKQAPDTPSHFPQNTTFQHQVKIYF